MLTKQLARHLMLLPSLACQAQCAYCFGPNRGGRMSLPVFVQALEWITATQPPGERLELTFHGGEPLLAGKDWYRQALPALRSRFGEKVGLGMQSNLWLLDDDFCELLQEYGVSLGASLDGPEALNDAQRGQGYYARTMAGIQTARCHGLSVGIICTFTRKSAPHYKEVFDFFASQGLGFSVHEAVSRLGDGDASGLALSPQEHADLFVQMFDAYLANVKTLRISTFDSMARGLSAGEGGLCTFGDCLGHYLTIAPDGGIFSCNRFAHHPEWRLGYVQDMPTLDDLARTPVWQHLRQRELSVKEDCGDCTHFNYCKGGCLYNAVVAEGGAATDRRDPHCTGYRRLFDHITERALAEVFSDENMQAVIEGGSSKHGLLRKGSLLQIMRDGPHPQKVARRARETMAAAALAASASPEEALARLEQVGGIITHPQRALESLRSLQARLAPSTERLVNAYLHLTYACNLACTHCYAQAGPQQSIAMPVAQMAELLRQCAAAGFRKAVLTGGEPLAHPQRDDLLDALAGLRPALKPMQLALRTNLAYPLSPALVERLAHSTHQVVVSVDGDEAAHDARRGAGTYARTLANLRTLLAARPSAEISLAAILTASQIAGPEGEAVRALGRELNISVRFKAVLPIGRGAELGLKPEYYNSLSEDSAESMACSASPGSTCGLGMNLYIAPDGDCYPCYALMEQQHHLGNALQDSLPAVLAQNDAYRRMTVDSNRQCRQCTLRYLCGGFCRAWSANGDPDAPPQDCAALHLRARRLLDGALEALEVSEEKWLAAGLPLPEQAPDRVEFS